LSAGDKQSQVSHRVSHTSSSPSVVSANPPKFNARAGKATAAASQRLAGRGGGSAAVTTCVAEAVVTHCFARWVLLSAQLVSEAMEEAGCSSNADCFHRSLQT